MNGVRKKICVVFGTRPEAIKLAPVILALRRDKRFETRICVTGQHRQMLDQVLTVFNIVPDVDLDLMRPGQSLAGLTARAIEAVDNCLAREEPHLVLVQGDTTTVFCATLASFYRHIPVGHVEAGLRTGDLLSPWPEEANRVLVSRLTSIHFAPTEKNKRNLVGEGVPEERIALTGNTVIDALLYATAQLEGSFPDIPGLPKEVLASWGERAVVLITGHRRESFGLGFDEICSAILELARMFPQVEFVYPVHLNPNVRAPVERILRKSEDNIHLLDPLPYLPFVAMMKRSKVILTDSGGVQEEAPSLGKPVLVMRDTTERPEAVEAGTVKLVGAHRAQIVSETARLLTDVGACAAMTRAHNPYGDGKASGRIVSACGAFLGV